MEILTVLTQRQGSAGAWKKVIRSSYKQRTQSTIGRTKRWEEANKAKESSISREELHIFSNNASRKFDRSVSQKESTSEKTQLRKSKSMVDLSRHKSVVEVITSLKI